MKCRALQWASPCLPGVILHPCALRFQQSGPSYDSQWSTLFSAYEPFLNMLIFHLALLFLSTLHLANSHHPSDLCLNVTFSERPSWPVFPYVLTLDKH